MGENGSGKTTLARAMLSAPKYARYVVIDSKGDFESDLGDIVITDPHDKRWGDGKRFSIHREAAERIIYKPSPQHGTGRWLDWKLKQLYARGRREGKSKPFIVYVDEALFLSKTGCTQWLSGLAVSGRSIGIGLWCSSQRPSWIPTEVKSEAWRWYVFSLGRADDMKEVTQYSREQLTVPMLMKSTEEYGFVEIRRDPQRAGGRLVTRFPPLAIEE